MPEYQDIGVDCQNFVATVEIQRPPHNFFDRHLIEQIADAFEALDKDENCRAIVLAAQGKSFCAGANFGSGQENDSTSDPSFSERGFKEDTVILYQQAVRLFRTKKPVVAAVHGAAIGGGLGVALVADFRVTCPEAKFSANFTALGIHAGFGLTVTLPQLIGQQAASLMFYTSKRIKGDEAYKMGLADVLTEQNQVREKAQALAAKIAACAPLAVQSMRLTLRHGLAERIKERAAHELKEQQWLRATEDAQEGILATSERRPGNFKNR